MGITMEPVSKYRRQVKRIYFDSFPKKDRMPYWMLLMANNEPYGNSRLLRPGPGMWIFLFRGGWKDHVYHVLGSGFQAAL